MLGCLGTYITTTTTFYLLLPHSTRMVYLTFWTIYGYPGFLFFAFKKFQLHIIRSFFASTRITNYFQWKCIEIPESCAPPLHFLLRYLEVSIHLSNQIILCVHQPTQACSVILLLGLFTKKASRINSNLSNNI